MIALNFEGQMLIDDSKIKYIINRIDACDLIKRSIDDVGNEYIEGAKIKIKKAYELIFEACRATIIVPNGLIPLVLNEEVDSQNHASLNKISKQIYSIFCEMFKLNPIVESDCSNFITYRKFQLYGIRKNLSTILYYLSTID